MEQGSYDVLIVGSGLAALTTALSLPKDCQILLGRVPIWIMRLKID